MDADRIGRTDALNLALADWQQRAVPSCRVCAGSGVAPDPADLGPCECVKARARAAGEEPAAY